MVHGEKFNHLYLFFIDTSHAQKSVELIDKTKGQFDYSSTLIQNGDRSNLMTAKIK